MKRTLKTVKEQVELARAWSDATLHLVDTVCDAFVIAVATKVWRPFAGPPEVFSCI